MGHSPIPNIRLSEAEGLQASGDLHFFGDDAGRHVASAIYNLLLAFSIIMLSVYYYTHE